MKLILEEPLKKHTQENNLHDIIVEVGDCIACGGTYKNVNARFLEPTETILKKDYMVVESELGHIYLPKDNIEVGETIRFVWKSYYWRDGLGVAGINAIQT